MADYPTKEQLDASAEQYALSPKFYSHPDEPGTEFKPKYAEVRFLTISGTRRNKPVGDLRYLDVINFNAVGGIITNITSAKQMNEYLIKTYPKIKKLDKDTLSDDEIHKALGTEASHSSGSRKRSLKSPIDIDIMEQCYVAIILHNKLNWRFAPRSRGITTKKFYGCDNFGLTFVTPDKDDHLTFSDPTKVRSVPTDNCRQLYFSAARRRPDCDPEVPGYHSAQKFNFHIDFFDESLQHSLPTIFDPTVPNSGGASFP